MALWDRLYEEPGFGIWLQNFREIFMDEQANAEFSEYIADRIRQRVHDPEVAEKLIPQDHGFGVQRVPLSVGLATGGIVGAVFPFGPFVVDIWLGRIARSARRDGLARARIRRQTDGHRARAPVR